MFNPEKKRVKACVFDLGNTLVNDTLLVKATTVDLGEWLIANAHLDSATDFVSTYQQINYSTNKPFISHTYGELEFFEQTFKELSVDTVSAETALKKYRELLIDKFQTDGHIVEAFYFLREKGIQIALLSNERVARVDAYLEKTGLAGFFDTVIVSEAIGAEKPDLRIFIEALTHLNIENHEMVMFGDNEIADGACSQLGIFFVLVTAYKNKAWIWEKGTSFKPDYVMKKITREAMQTFFDTVSSNP